jgi:hypothetical protein
MASVGVWILVTLGVAPVGAAAEESVGAAAQEPAPSAGPLTSPAGIQSEDPSAHLQYASILFYRGRQLLSPLGDREAALAVFRVVEAELLEARRLSEQHPDGVERRLLRSQCAFLLGDLHFFVFEDHALAQAFYQESLEQFPDHAGALEALKRFPAP